MITRFLDKYVVVPLVSRIAFLCGRIRYTWNAHYYNPGDGNYF